MCGIYGWFGTMPDAPQQINENLGRLLYHRGPDDAGFEYGRGWGLGFRRLSILDLSPLGHQPMASQDRRFWLAFNGEIYNYIELRESFERQGAIFQSESDTEVLLHVLQHYGVDGLNLVNGMFALSFVDLEKRRFILARDRLGQKPLYYLQQNGQLRFASELKALLAWPNAPRTINELAVAEYMALAYLSSDTCIFEGYKKLRPAHYLSGSLDAPSDASNQCYWNVELNDEEGDGHLAKNDLDDLAELLTDSVKIRLRSDVPTGVFLSGGIDSGLVATLAGQAAESNPPLALTVGFEEAKFDESKLADCVARHAGLEHKIITHRASSLADIDRVTWFYDEPFGDVSALPSMALCEAAAKVGTVFLSGDGGDEAFGGYDRYIKTKRYEWLQTIPEYANKGIRSVSQWLPTYSRLRYQLSKSSVPFAGFAAAFDETPADPVLAQVLPAAWHDRIPGAADPLWSRWHKTSNKRSLLARQQMLDYSLYLPDDVLVKMDRASMANSIEVRSPFLDHRLVEWSATLPRSTLIQDNLGKIPLRRLGRRLLPEPSNHATKMGFGVPIGAWFQQVEGQRFLRERLLSSEAKRRGLWNLANVEQLINAQSKVEKGRDLGTWLWRLVMLDAWCRQYLDGTNFMAGPLAIRHHA